jgi:exopolysaccharide biosynthesis polyprenyl glycosylphosphotransferase
MHGRGGFQDVALADLEPTGSDAIAPAGRERRRWPVSRMRGVGPQARSAWRRGYVRRAVLLDLASAAAAGGVAHALRFGEGDSRLTDTSTSPLLIVGLAVVWVFSMLAARAYEERFLWVGPEEFRRVFFAAALLLATVGTVSWALKLEVARGFVVIALPLAMLLTLLQRVAHRSWLRRERRGGRFQQTAVLVGHPSSIADLHAKMSRDTSHGYRVIGCCLPNIPTDRLGVFDGIPVLGTLDEVVTVVQRYEVDTVAVLPCPELDGSRLRSLGWDLERTDAELLLAPAVTEVAGPRVRIRPVCGLPLLHMERPEFSGFRRVLKSTFDRTMALLGVILLLPVLVLIALAVKVTSRGPVLYRHERIGRGGRPFHLLKFRSMTVGADKQFDSLLPHSDGNAVQFKMRADPRVTPIGRILRRYSLDELPQLFNVLGGSMSLVGPRPHVTREVEQYGFDMRRRLLVKPGITGLWQVSGRSNLSWDESVTIDVRYVENWSLTMDLGILARTLGAVIRGSGAY